MFFSLTSPFQISLRGWRRGPRWRLERGWPSLLIVNYDLISITFNPILVTLRPLR